MVPNSRLSCKEKHTICTINKFDIIIINRIVHYIEGVLKEVSVNPPTKQPLNVIELCS